MSSKLQNAKDSYIMSTMEELVPQNHLVRRLDKYINFEFIRELAAPHYSSIGRPGYDPVIIFKLAFLKSVFGIPSMRKTCEELEVNIAYRWFLGIPFNESIPVHSTYSKNYLHRFMNTNIYETVFERILDQIIDKGLIDFTNINIDSTHLKASANRRKSIEKYVRREKSVFEDEMLQFINDEREKDDDKPLPPSKPKGDKRTKESTTDSDSGWLNKGEKEKNFSYNAHSACDKNGYVLKSIIKPSNIHDSKVFPLVYDDLNEKYKEKILSIAIDRGYYSGPIIKMICDNNHLPLLPYKRPMGKKNYELFKTLVYDALTNSYCDKKGLIYRYAKINRQGYKIYRNQFKQELRISIYKPYFDYARDLRLSDYGKEIYGLRKQTIERCFADFKERHFGRYTHYRGIKKVSDHTLLTFACMNMKKMVNFLSGRDNKGPLLSKFSAKILYFLEKMKKSTFLILGSKTSF